MIGKTISHFKIQSDLGEGGMGKVYLALDTELQREVALKFLLPHLTEDEKINSRFKQEARTLATLNHPNIITIYEVGEFEEHSFIATEYIKGQSLETILFNKTLSIKQILDIVMQLCDGLHEAHAQGVIHRDIKPGNIIIEKSGHVKILDFGLAKLKEAGRKTSTSTTLGTLYYLSPEQIQNSTVDQRTDIFATGILLYEMITGQLPFRGDHEAAVMYTILNEDPEPLTRYKSGISPNLQNIVLKALRKNPDMRYQHIDDLLSDLKNELSETETSTISIKKSTQEKTIRKLAAIMFTDIFRYSHMMGKDEEKAFNLLEDYDTLVTPLIENQNGQILKKIGDGFFCEFSSALEAVECALDIQNALNDYNLNQGKDFQLKVRIGIHVGDVIKKENDLFGDGVNVAARIEPLAPPGGIYISETVYSAISSHPKFEIIDIGPQTLKNIDKATTLYQIVTGFENPIEKTKTSPIKSPPKTKKISTRNDQQQNQQFTLPKFVWIFSIAVIITVVAIWLSNLSNSTNPIPVGQSETNTQDAKDTKSNYPEVSKLLESEKSKKFVSDILKIEDSNTLLNFLKEKKNLGRLTFGKKGDYSEIESKYVIILDEQRIHSLLLYHNQKYFDVMGNDIYHDLSENFRGKREIWIDL